MYRAYPAPSQTAQRSSSQGRSRRNGASPAPPPQQGRNIGRNSMANDSRIPGLPLPSPVKSVAPPSKKQRAIPSAPPRRSGTDELTKIANDGIAGRRGELRNLRSHRSTTEDLLARARAVTSAPSSSPSQSTQVSRNNISTHANLQAYNARTRPVAVPTAPPRQLPVAAVERDRSESRVPTVPPSQDRVNTNSAASGAAKLNINTDPKNLGRENTLAPGKPRSPNQKVEVQTPFLSSSEVANIKPLSNIQHRTSEAVPEKKVEKLSEPPKAAPTDASKFDSTVHSNIMPPPRNENYNIPHAGAGTAKVENKTSEPPPLIQSYSEFHNLSHGQNEKNMQPPTMESSKRETLKSLRNAAHSPTPVVKKGKEHKVQSSGDINNKSSISKTMKELLEAKNLREDALKQVAQLEKEVLVLRLEREKNASQAQETKIRRGRSRSISRMIGQERNRSLSRTSRREQLKSPQPTNRSRSDQHSNPLSDDNIACRAVETVDDIYSSDLATYVVRKPYGGNEKMEHSFELSSGAKNNDCQVSWHESVRSYLQKANVQDEASIEVIAKVRADNSVLLLHGSSCRHGTAILGNKRNVVGYEWKTYDIEKMDGSLGKIIYIDVYGNDGEYWLDSVYEEALKIRENYCSNVFSAALALKASSYEKQESEASQNGRTNRSQQPLWQQQSPQMINGHSQHTQHLPPQPQPLQGSRDKTTKETPKTIDACVGTSDDFPHYQEQMKKQTNVKPSNDQSTKKVDSKQADTESGSTDALSAFLIFFFGTCFRIFWYFFCIPFKLMKWTLMTSICFCFVSMLWLYIADDNGAAKLGAGIDFQLNSPGVH